MHVGAQFCAPYAVAAWQVFSSPTWTPAKLFPDFNPYMALLFHHLSVIRRFS
jgi:hypothetical protein